MLTELKRLPLDSYTSIYLLLMLLQVASSLLSNSYFITACKALILACKCKHAPVNIYIIVRLLFICMITINFLLSVWDMYRLW